MKTPSPRSSNFFGMRSTPHHGENDTWLEPEEITYPSGAMIRRCRAVCPDGIPRVVTCGIADTFFSIPGRVKIKGKSTRGYISDKDGTYIFTPYTKQS